MTDNNHRPAETNGESGDLVLRADLAIFAHELRGALTVIAGYGVMLHRALPETQRLAALDGIRRAVARADALCGAVLEDRFATESTKMPRSLVELCALAERIAAEQRAATERTIVVETDDDIAILGDEDALARVLTNLVANAAKYSPAGTAVHVRVARETTLALGTTVIVEVSDRGPGIPSEARERIFEPFERLARDSETPGTGLGLAIIRDVVTAHSGFVNIHDREGGGTTMRVEIPVAARR
jgi:signal transduction histidine kinase